MFYRYVETVRKPVDLYDLHSGPCWIVGSAPSLQAELPHLQKSRVPLIVMNNAARNIRPTYWLGADRPEQYAESFLLDSRFMKFGRYNYRNEEVSGRPWCEHPNTLFYGVQKGELPTAFCREVNLVWGNNVLSTAFQLAIRLGFTELRFVGCDMKLAIEQPYSYPHELTQDEVKYNQGTYDIATKQIRYFVNAPQGKKLKFYVCNSESALSELMPVKSAAEFVGEEPELASEAKVGHVLRKV